MTKKIVAIGGGENGRKTSDGTYTPYETGPMDMEIIKLTGKEHPNFLFIAHTISSEQGQQGYFETMQRIYGEKYGCECRLLKTTDLTNKE